MIRTGLAYENDDEPIPGYRLVARLGRGGAGEVWRAVAPGGINVALKVVNKLQEGGGRREMQGLQRIKNISHNHLCRIQGFWTKDKDGYVLDTSTAFASEGSLTDTVTPSVEQGNAVQLIIAMELGDETLADTFERCNAGRLAEARVGIPIEDLFRYIEAAGLAVDHLNQKHHICHCDLKPQNILLVNGEAKVCDFGLARQVVDTKKTMAPAFTPQYGAPEMMVGAEYHPRMDQYSLALTYAELRTGHFPFPAFTRVTTESQLAVLAREKWDGKFDLSALPKAERKVVAKALSPAPDDRYETIEQMLDALRVAIFPGNRNPRKPSPGNRSPGNRSWWFAATAVSCSLMVLAFLLFRWGAIERIRDWMTAKGGSEIGGSRNGTGDGPTGEETSDTGEEAPDLDKILDPADKTLREFKEGNDVRPLKDALAAIEQVLTQGRHHARAAELRKQCLEWYFRLADGQLERDDAAQVRPYLAVIEDHCQKFPQPPKTDLYRARVDLYRARVYAAEGNWAQVQPVLDQLRPGQKALSPEDRIQFLLLVTRLARNEDPNSLCSKDGLKNLRELKAAAAQLTAKEAKEVAEIDAFTKQQLHANWKNLPQAVKSAATEMWPNIEFELKLADAFQRVQSDGTDDLQEARRLLMELQPHLQLPSSTPQQRWEVSFLKVLLDLKQRENQTSVTAVLPGLESLLTKPCGESLHKPVELFTALADRFQSELKANQLDPDTTLLGWDLWCKQADKEPDGTVDNRLRALALVARLSKDPPDDAVVRKDAEPLIASGSQFTIAAWAESVLAQGGPKAQEESQWQSAKKTINDDQPKAFYPDYVLFVRAWILDRLEG
ncbi:MAG: serine/threonine-protein kinase, partial [Planctomycetota bacterium]|nr:serine/threonine-protein kinase [Planctomycetota bacterium]